MRSSFIIGMLLLLSLQAKRIAYCQCPVPWGAIHEQQEQEERQKKMRQLNNLFNELTKQGETIEITTDKDVKLLIKQRKMVDTTVSNEELSLTDYILGGIGIIMVLCLPFLALFIMEQATK